MTFKISEVDSSGADSPSQVDSSEVGSAPIAPDPSVGLSSTTVQAALVELAGDTDQNKAAIAELDDMQDLATLFLNSIQ